MDKRKCFRLSVVQTGFAATITFNSDGTYTYQVSDPNRPIDFSGKWELTRNALRMNIAQKTGTTMVTLHWRVEKFDASALTVHGRFTDETWKKQ